MAARDSMGYLIALLRTKVNDGGSDIWTNDELQTYLDMHKVRIRRELLRYDADQKLYLSALGLLEGTYNSSTDSGASWDDDSTIIKIWQSASGGATSAGSPDHWNLTEGAFWWNADQNDTYYLDAIHYNLEGAIAECLEQLAMDPQKARVWGRGGVTYTHYSLMQMAEYHRKLAGARSTKLKRTYRTEK